MMQTVGGGFTTNGTYSYHMTPEANFLMTTSLEVTPESFANTGILRTTGVGRTLGDVAMGKGEEWCVTYRRQIVLCEF